MTEMNDRVIAEFRANAGNVAMNGFGDRLVLVHNRGTRSGEIRVTPLMAIPEGDSWLIAASAAGKQTDPPWYGNLLATPETEVEVPADGGVRTVPVTATDLRGDDRDTAWKKFTSASPGFAAYEKKAGARVIPVLRLTPR